MVPMFSKKGAPIYKYTQWEKFLQKILEISKFTFTIAWESMSMRLCCAISRQPEMTLDANIVTHAPDQVTFGARLYIIFFVKNIFIVQFKGDKPEMTLDAYIVTLAADRVAFAGAWHGILYISFH